MLATVTSLPELASGISAVALVDAPNLAVGNALGACVLNLADLLVVDALQRRQPIFVEASDSHLLSAAFGVVMPGFVAMSVPVGARAPAVLNVGLYSPALLALYLLALCSVHGRGPRVPASNAVDRAGASAHRPDPKVLWRRFPAAVAAALVAGTTLPHAADGLAAGFGLSRDVVGTLLMSAATTLPEAAVTMAALRIRAFDLAIGNLLGSSLFNATILAVDDLSYRRGPLLPDAALVHSGTAISAAVMSGLVVVGIVMRLPGRVLRVTSWIGIGLASAYVLDAARVYGSAD